MKTLRWLLSRPFVVIGYLGVIGAGLLVLYNSWRTIEADQSVKMSLGDLWFQLSPETLQLAQPAVQRYLHPAIWDPGILTVLLLPGWLGLVLIAVLSLVIAKLIYRG